MNKTVWSNTGTNLDAKATAAMRKANLNDGGAGEGESADDHGVDFEAVAGLGAQGGVGVGQVEAG